jgi:hypothetical protein
MVSKRRFLQFFGGTLWLAGAGNANALEAPTGSVILTISGKVTSPNIGQTAGFSMAMLEALPQKTFTTKTPWYPAPVEFTGPLLRDVLAAAGSKGDKLVALALNDYKTEIPMTDTIAHDMIVARLLNGKPMAIRDRGPLFIVYPFDTKAELRAERYYNRSAWQLSRLIVQ